MQLNICSQNPYHASEDSIFISISGPSMALNASQHVFNQTHSMPAMTQNVSQHELTKHILNQQGYKMQLNMC